MLTQTAYNLLDPDSSVHGVDGTTAEERVASLPATGRSEYDEDSYYEYSDPSGNAYDKEVYYYSSQDGQDDLIDNSFCASKPSRKPPPRPPR